ncbi:phosphoenolpyruvate--protein phosphotransferase [Thalassospiraceae bacterium LMO-JJ14]|nr:phosphoenolpyruvate--protein phosphotransferase [Thalassospiraceae bacterium LMO-JJ14]
MSERTPRAKLTPAPRRLLARVRDLMADTGTAEKRLEQIAEIVAADLVAEVCSIYVRRAGDILELFATRGLKTSAIHNTRLRIGEGIIGEIAAMARPFALADAQQHPSFAYRPETGEEIFHSMMGVPIIRSGRVIGVMAVQNRTRRKYNDEEVESLQTVAMVLAELVAGGELIDPNELLPADGLASAPLRLEGLRLNGGIGIGQAVVHRPHFRIERLVAEDPEIELGRLQTAFVEMHGAIDDMMTSEHMKSSGEHRDIMETYSMIARDQGWLKRMEEAIKAGLTAEAAVQRVLDDLRARMAQISDPYLRERVHDFEDLAHRLLQHLIGDPSGPDLSSFEDGAILIAKSLGPAQLLDYDAKHLRGVILEEGSPTAHVAIIARALDIPVIGRIKGVMDRISEGDPVVVDGDRAQVFLRPGEDIRRSFLDTVRIHKERLEYYNELIPLPSDTKDEQHVTLLANAGLLVDVEQMSSLGAEGIGLFRTEIHFMMRPELPSIEDQTDFYRRTIEVADGRHVTFRTLDVGSDKTLPYLESDDEENPSMGWRAIRVGLDRPMLLRRQMRAMVRAAKQCKTDISIMFPMITEVEEFVAAKKLLMREIESEAPGQEIHAGAMLEVPSLLFQLDQLMAQVDFLSVGSNDLMQFMFATDRGNPRLSDRYDTLSPAALRMLKTIVDSCNQAGVPVTVCGEMAGRPLEAMALVGLGYRRLSMANPSIGPVKEMTRSLNVKALEGFVTPLLGSAEHSLRGKLRSFALDHGVAV